MEKRNAIFGAWPYANGPRHLGHASSLLPGDIVARQSRMKGQETIFVSGSDINGTPAEMAAEKVNRPVGEYTEEISRVIQKDFMLLGMSYDLYTHTRTAEHKKITQEIMNSLFESKVITFGYADCAYEVITSQVEKKALQDRFIEGECPHCHNLARGDQCDFCSNLLNPTDLINPRAKNSNNKVEFISTPHLFLNLQLFNKELTDWLGGNNLNIRKHAKTKSIQDAGVLRERMISRDIKWGIPLPDDIVSQYPNELRNKVMYVWFEAVIGYVSAVIEYEQNYGDGDFMKWWESEKANHYYSHGKDNVPFHTIFWPALLMGYNKYLEVKGQKGLQLPTHILSTNNLNYGDDKFSSSRGNVVGISDLVNKYGQDAVRYYLIINSPETNDINFTEPEMARFYNELSSNWGNAVNRAIKPLASNFGGKSTKFELNEVGGEALAKAVETAFAEISQLISDGKIKESIKYVYELTSKFNKYLAEAKPWTVIKNDKELAHKILSFSMWVIDNISILYAPYIPESSAKVQQVFGANIDLKGKFETDEKINPDGVSRQYFRYINPFNATEPVWKVLALDKKYYIKDIDVLPLFPKLL